FGKIGDTSGLCGMLFLGHYSLLYTFDLYYFCHEMFTNPAVSLFMGNRFLETSTIDGAIQSVVKELVNVFCRNNQVVENCFKPKSPKHGTIPSQTLNTQTSTSDGGMEKRYRDVIRKV
ncbi:protein nfi- isoform a, partial [Lasius niger]